MFLTNNLLSYFDLTDTANQKCRNSIYICLKGLVFDNSPIIFFNKSTEIQIFIALNYIKDKNGNNGKL